MEACINVITVDAWSMVGIACAFLIFGFVGGFAAGFKYLEHKLSKGTEEAVPPSPVKAVR